jgi:hypothetical protein
MKKITLTVIGVSLILFSAISMAAPLRFNAAGSADVSGYVEFDDTNLLFDGTCESNTNVIDLDLQVTAGADTIHFTFADVETLDDTVLVTVDAMPSIENGCGYLAIQGDWAVGFWPDGWLGTPTDGDAALLLVNQSTEAEFAYAVRWDIDESYAGLALFRVTKTFSDGRDDEVDVHLSCNSGLPLEQDFTISGGGDGVQFVVTELQGTETVCEVTESGGPAGYTPVLNGGDGCTWEGVTGGLFTCEITNEADPADFTVTKDWVIEGAVGEEVLLEAEVTIECSSDILTIDGDEIGDPDGSVSANLSGDGDSVTVTVDTTLGSTSCSAYESIYQTGVESTDDCGPRSIAAGGSSSCTITNTVFFEGIPTLSQYGLAVMALLMLGLGFVGLRRFV